MSREWSPQQRAVFEWFRAGTGNLVVRARAGTGKTTTIIEGLTYAPERSILLAAFNKRIAEELQAKIRNPNATAATLHSVGYKIVMRYWERTRPDSARGERLARAAAGMDAPDAMVRLVTKLAGLAKGMAPWGTQDELCDIAERHECVPDEEWEEDGWDVERVARYARDAMERARDRDPERVIDFDDMLYLPPANKWAAGKYDLVVIDECQDMNAAQIELAQRVCRPGGRIVVVGDDRQAIYGFRGADSGSIDRLKGALKATELPLNITYRCAQTIVRAAAEIVPDYKAAPSAPAGTIDTMAEDKMVASAEPGDFVLSRKNAPLARTCLALLKAGKRARIAGADIGKGLIAIVEKLKARSIPELLGKLEAWKDRQVARAATLKKPEDKIALVTDQADTIRSIAESLASVREVRTRIETLFSDNGPPAIVCSSVHKAKGLEAETAYVLKWTLKGRTATEEANIEYVAITRAKTRLVWVTEGASAPAAEKKPEPVAGPQPFENIGGGK